MAITTLNNRSINRSDTASADQVWTATSATASDFQAAEKNLPYFMAQSGSLTPSASTSTKVPLSVSGGLDSESSFDETNDRYTPQTAGKYWIEMIIGVTSMADGGYAVGYLKKNGSTVAEHNFTCSRPSATMHESASFGEIVEFNGSTDYIELYILFEDAWAVRTNQTQLQGFLISAT
jgi:hypothetical protein